MFCQLLDVGIEHAVAHIAIKKVSRFPAPAYGGRRLHSTACNDAHDPSGAVRVAHSPNQGRRVACGSELAAFIEHPGGAAAQAQCVGAALVVA